MEPDNDKMRQNPGAQQGNLNQDRDSGQEALGSNQDIKQIEQQETTGRSRSDEEEEDEDIIDSGGIATAAFDEGGEPRSPDSLENRGITQGSDDTPQ